MRPVSILLIAVCFVLNSAVALTVLSPKQYSVAVGDIAIDTIYATRTIEDSVTTAALRQAARNAVSPVYAVDSASAEKLVTDASAFFTALKGVREKAREVRLESAPVVTGEDGEQTAGDDTRTWQVVIPQDNLRILFRALPITIADTTLLYNVLAASDEEITRLEDTVISKLSVILTDGVSEEELPAERTRISKELQVTTIPVYLKSLGEIVYDTYFQPTNVVDTTAMNAAREKAASEVEPVYISRGTAIVEAGQVVTADQMTTLLALDLVRGVDENKLLPLGMLGLLFGLYTLFTYYLYVFENEVFCDSKRMTMLFVALAITIALEWICYALDPRILPCMLAVLLCAELISPRLAQSVNVLTAFSLGILAGGSGAGLLGSDAMLAVAASVAGGQAAVLIAQRSSNRGALIAAGAVSAAVGAAVVLAGASALGSAWRTAAVMVGCVAASPLILSVFAVGMLSLWENAFDIVTTPRLHELLNASQPLIKKMMTSAPGTYHHSMMTAALAEGAAHAVGANALLARAGAVYHDVGKLRRPNYFMENQKSANIHDTLPPEESAGVIIAHQRDAEPLLSRYRIPSAVRRIAAEHHGTTLVAYFYQKAVRQRGEDAEGPLDEKPYRYPGPEPSTRESAIVMLADSCEAAVRSMQEPTRDEMAAMVRRVIQGKVDDGQLNKAPLTLAEITRIEKSFLVTMNGLLHERIRYPGDDKV